MNRSELIREYVDFFVGNGHRKIPSASLIPENDPTVLFTTAGMHPLVPFLQGQKHPLGARLVSVQKCVRLGDIEKVGNETHHTFFEMLGNWSLGDYFKREAIEMSFEFLTKVLRIPVEKLAVSCFVGDGNVEKDLESAGIWKRLGISKERIVFLGRKDNWWGPAGTSGPCGPDSEMFYWASDESVPEKFNPANKNWVEIWNDVFMQYNKTIEGIYGPLVQKNVDTGMGVERTVAVLNGLNDNYESEIFKPLIEKIEKISGRVYSMDKRSFRIVADHLRAAVFILGDERKIAPSNVGQGYILRRLIRRAVRYGKLLGIQENFLSELAKVVVMQFGKSYPELISNEKFIFDELEREENKFRLTLEKGLKKFSSIVLDGNISGMDAFLLFQSYGFPIEMTREMALADRKEVDSEGFEKEFKKHQELSRTSSAGQFKSGLADDSEKTTRLHTANHLLLATLRKVLKFDVRQRGSNINSERMRFDFSFDRKLSDSELRAVEGIVNLKISQGLEVMREEMALQDAFDSGAQGEFGAKYPDVVSVYTVVDSDEKTGWFSKEICTGPHVSNTSEIGVFKILKEQSVSAGVRRIKAVVG